jgi:hypothetical protein
MNEFAYNNHKLNKMKLTYGTKHSNVWDKCCMKYLNYENCNQFCDPIPTHFHVFSYVGQANHVQAPLFCDVSGTFGCESTMENTIKM